MWFQTGKKSHAIQAKLAALQKLQAARFLQGNLLNALQHATVDGVQLTRLRVDQSYILTAEPTRKPTATMRLPVARPPSRERIIVHLDARDFSANPGDQVNKFKEAIAKQAYFQAMLDKTNGVQLASPPFAPQTDAGKPYVMFTLDCRFTEGDPMNKLPKEKRDHLILVGMGTVLVLIGIGYGLIRPQYADHRGSQFPS